MIGNKLKDLRKELGDKIGDHISLVSQVFEQPLDNRGYDAFDILRMAHWQW